MKLTKEHKEALRDFHFNYHKQIPTYTQDELIQYIVDNFDQILQNQEDAKKLQQMDALCPKEKYPNGISSLFIDILNGKIILDFDGKNEKIIERLQKELSVRKEHYLKNKYREGGIIDLSDSLDKENRNEMYLLQKILGEKNES